ncbi:hypothetical protein BCR34DRAFT_570492 [Clohesyomyces aquaticus]|uniref:Short-chain dehydrogenase/ reductase-like protein n=1 Tax=Clohesyomyces aquaticus TaxID=1231657 RepID=A0A1Y1ZC16_9PLEO|nr:hypothetical protein BCR34DRAFT_570492 [Clohesyomyces aquaticus]
MLVRTKLLEGHINALPTNDRLSNNIQSHQSNMSLKYKKVLLIGASSGIGEAYAKKIVGDGKQVVVVGRRKENLDAFVKNQGQGKADAFQFDITKLDEIPKFAEDITGIHPDIDCVIINSGIQRGFDFSKPESVDLSAVTLEFTTNYLSYIHLTTAFLSHLQKQKNETALMYTSSGLALIPITRCANYCASKAALHHFVLCLREQVKDGPGNVKIVEIFPPAVQTELHDEKHQPDIKDGGKIGMPLKQYTEESWAMIVKGEENVPVGMSSNLFNLFENTRQEQFHKMVKMMKGGP